ncbi:MAG: hypothetical protein R6U27_07300 [Desulfobacterales bacterium]
MKKSIFLLAIMSISIMTFLACTSTSVKKDSAAGQVDAPAGKVMANQYYEFSDVLIPGELKVKPNRSSIYRTPGFAAGLLVFQGRIDAGSLSSFFESNMAKDNWRYSAAFKYNPLILIFEKENRACVIRIEESTFWTHVEIWMAPTSKENVPAVFN